MGSRLVGVRFFALDRAEVGRRVRQPGGSVEVESVIPPSIEGSISAVSELTSPMFMDPSSPTQAPYDEETLSIPSSRVLGSVASLVRETRYAVMSGNRSLCNNIAEIYSVLGEHHTELRKIKLAVERQRSPSGERQVTCSSNCELHNPYTSVSPPSDCDSDDDHDSSTTEVFFDCVSRFSVNGSSSSIDRLCRRFSGSPDYYLESMPSYYAEHYSGSSFRGAVFVSAIMRSPNDNRTRKYFIFYAETARRWHRIIMSATFNDIDEPSIISPSMSPADWASITVPKALQNLFESLIPGVELLSSVTSIRVSLTVRQSGCIVVNPSRIDISEDPQEKEMSIEDQIMHDIEHLGCHKFRESEVIIRSRSFSNRYEVRVNSQAYSERMIPFASAGLKPENKMRHFWDEIKLLKSFPPCAKVAQFIGVVLDDSGRYLKGYLYESPFIPSLYRLMAFATRDSQYISWAIRNIWVKQIIEAILNVHERGLIQGCLRLSDFGIRADGTVILARFRPYRELTNENGCTPPELRESFKVKDDFYKMLNYQSDIFQLGQILWLLAEHRASSSGLLCARSACATSSRIICTAPHKNPVELPACPADTPSYLGEIIKQCRSEEPKNRPSAHELARRLSFINTDISPPGMVELLEKHSKLLYTMQVHCVKCGAVTTEIHYHCDICQSADFDICPACFLEGVHCYVPQHQLMRRVMKDGKIVDGST